MKYLYNTGLVIGRFQCFHRGHEFLIRRALSLCKTVVIYIGSAQAHNTKENPFSYLQRKDLITKVFKKELRSKRILIFPLYDIGAGNNTNWGMHVLSCFNNDVGCLPDLYITGCEKERSSWFTNELAPTMDELRITRHSIKVTGTECRQCLEKDETLEKWMRLVPHQLYNSYNELKEIYKNVKG